jgi:hypothetical protein
MPWNTIVVLRYSRSGAESLSAVGNSALTVGNSQQVPNCWSVSSAVACCCQDSNSSQQSILHRG